MSSVSTEIFILLLLILINGVFSMSEMAIVSARKNRLQEKADSGSQGAKTALSLADNPNRFLSTVQVGITLIGILSGAFGGATLAEEIGKGLERYPLIKPYSEGIGVGIVVAVITYLSLVLGELVPKRLALNNAEGVAISISRVMRALSVAATPLVSVLSHSTDLILKIMGARPNSEPAVTMEDVRSMINQGTQIGIFEKAEQQMVTHVFRLGDRSVTTVMTPRTEIVFLNADDSIAEISQVIVESGYSRYPLFQETLDNVLGFIHVKDLFRDTLRGKPLSVQEALKPALFVPDTMTALQVLERMKQAGTEVALIIDEYGGVSGLVSINDILEAIVGGANIPQSSAELEIVRREDGSLLVDGMLQTEELKEVLNMNRLPEEGKGYYETLGGLLMTVLGRIPATGDIYEWEGFRFEVMDMDGLRVDKVLIGPAAVQTGESTAE